MSTNTEILFYLERAAESLSEIEKRLASTHIISEKDRYMIVKSLRLQIELLVLETRAEISHRK